MRNTYYKDSILEVITSKPGDSGKFYLLSIFVSFKHVIIYKNVFIIITCVFYVKTLDYLDSPYQLKNLVPHASGYFFFFVF